MRRTAEENSEITGAWDLRKVIHPGDSIMFNSTARARTVTELCRAPGATVVAEGTAKEVYKNWVLVVFPSGVREGANRGNIIEVAHA